MSKITDYRIVLAESPRTSELRAACFLREKIKLVCGERFWYQDCGEGLNTHNVGFIHSRTMMKGFGIKDENVYVSLGDIDSFPLPMPIY